MPFGKGRRKLWLVLGFLLAALAMIWFACPLWFPWVLRPLASRAGARVGSYQRLSYSRFSIHDLALTNESLILHARRVDGLIPSIWLWRLATGRTAAQDLFLQVTNWDCRLLPGNKSAHATYDQVADAAAALHMLRKWIPHATFSNGIVHSDDTTFVIQDAIWSDGTLQTQLRLPPNVSDETIQAKLSPGGPFGLQIASPTRGITSSFEILTNNSGLDVRNLTEWRNNRFEFKAHFGSRDVLPETASLEARDVHVPTNLARLPGYREVSGSLSALWQTGQFSASLTAAATPMEGETNLPPVDVHLRVQGDTNSCAVQTLQVHAPFLEAQISNPVMLAFSPPFVRGPATLRLEVDLAQQHWADLTGKLSGQADVSSRQGRFPQTQLRLTGANIGNNSLMADSVALSATLDWPLLEVSRLNLRFDDGSAATISGKVDLDQKSATEGRFQFDGQLAQRWLPAGYSYDQTSVSAAFQGPLEKLAHSGRLVVRGVDTPVVRPFDFNLKWEGEAATLKGFELELQQTNSSVTATGGLILTPGPAQLRLESLALSTNRTKALALSGPATIKFAPQRSGTPSLLDATQIRLTGPAGDLAAKAFLQWPNQGVIELFLQRFPLELLSRFTKNPFPRLQVRELAAAVNWSNGPANMRLEASGTGVAQPPKSASREPGKQETPGSVSVVEERLLATPLNFEIHLSGDSHGLALSNLVINTSTSSVAVAHGFLPLVITPASSTNLINIAPQSELLLNASLRPESFFWQDLAELTGLRLDDPVLDLSLSGTASAPEGKARLHARGIQLIRTKSFPLSLQDLRLTLSLDRQKAHLTEGQLLVQGQRVGLTGELPLGQNAWNGLLRKQLPALDRANVHLQVQNAELAAFEPLFPELLAPQGNLNLDLQLQPGLKLEGAILLRRARTRPLGNTAPIRDINVTLRFHDRIMMLENATASLSGAEVDLNGKADLRGTNWLNGGLPPFDLVLKGTNVPLAREPEYIIRSDLNLAVIKTNDSPPLVSGTVRLRDSFYLSDLEALVPGKVAASSSRPPYFSIDNPTLAGWRLAVKVEGARWLKLRTSLFNGEVSANLHLQGSLEEPIALGLLKVDSGLVRFPFANLQVQQGLVTLSSEDPYHPQLLVRASSKQFGYDIRMEVTGSADSPIIQFTSNPSLSSEQILLMITAGQLPPGSFTLTPQQRAQTVALFLGRDILAKLGLGDQSEERLTVSSGEEISQQGRPTYHVKYKLSKRWSVEGEYDRFGDFNAGLKWRIYSK